MFAQHGAHDQWMSSLARNRATSDAGLKCGNCAYRIWDDETMKYERPNLVPLLIKVIALPTVFVVAYFVTTLIIKIKYGI
jgi:hypothetical protein